MKTVIPRCRKRYLCTGSPYFWTQKSCRNKSDSYLSDSIFISGSVFRIRLLQQMLTDAKHIAGADGQNDITRTGDPAQLALDFRKGRVEFRTRDLRGQIGRRNADGVFLARGVYLREEEDIAAR